ncbi:MAG: HAMP domain-containing histidine kinase [Ignavibacteria bacterium]|nr:HAMP domain-containing histidine kinase [Ignavibacteria bacterium]
MKIKMSLFGKMILLSGFIEIIMLLIVIFSMYALYLNERNYRYLLLESLIIESSNKRLELLVRRDTNFKSIFTHNKAIVLNNLLKYYEVSQKIPANNDKIILDSLKNLYSDYFKKYTVLLEKFGLDENTGIEGEFRGKIHQIESFLKSINNYYLLALTLEARRREKDYMMRKRDEYVNKVHSTVDKIKNDLKFLNLSESEKIKMRTLIDNYLIAFNDFVRISKEIKDYENKMNEIEYQMKRIINVQVEKSKEEAESYHSFIVPFFVVSIIFSLVMSILISRSITNPIVRLKHATIKLASGDYRIKVKVESDDEIGDLANFFNKMVDNISTANETIIEQQKILHQQNIELKESNITKDKFFSIIAHDLKNPVSAFMGVSNFLSQTFHELSNEELKEFLDDVNNSAKQLYELLENLLMWSRCERGLIQYQPAVYELRQFITSNINLLKINADNKNISINYDLDKEYKVYTDANMLNTIIRNLCTNAIKFTHEGGTINIICREDDDNFCRISVSDNGVGIPKENLEKLFSLQNSVSTTGTKQESGTGLGLILCREFVEKHNGRIWVESTVNVGTTFHFTIPLGTGISASGEQNG